MVIILSEMPDTTLGIYTKGGVVPDSDLRKDPTQGKMGKHQLFLHPDAAASVMGMESQGFRLRFSDMLRSAEGSLKAVLTKAGTKAPSYSGHNYGFSVDIHVADCMYRFKFKTKAQLDQLMEHNGWYCHRRDHLLGPESWHYNFFGKDAERYLKSCSPASTSAGLEAKIVEFYGKDFVIKQAEIDASLKKLGFKSLTDFQTKMHMTPDGKPNLSTCRTLAFCSATTEIRPIPSLPVA